ncbi:hypothetical protein M9458_036275, partial [Cirrhinus mrigala]
AALAVVLSWFWRVCREPTLSATSLETCVKPWRTEDLSIPSPSTLVRLIHTEKQSVYLKEHFGHDGLYYFGEGSFLIGTLAKPRLQGAELRLQQHFRWVQLRWDTEPLNGMLGRHLRRKLLHK